MDKLTAIATPEKGLNLNETHSNAEKLIERFKSQLGEKKIKVNLLRSSYFKHDDDSTLAYIMHYKFYSNGAELPEYSLYLYSNAEIGEILIPFLGHYGHSGAITIFHNEEINNVPKVMMELTEAINNEHMYDVQFNF